MLWYAIVFVTLQFIQGVNLSKYRKLTQEEELERNGYNYCECGHNEIFEHKWSGAKVCHECNCDGYTFKVRR